MRQLVRSVVMVLALAALLAVAAVPARAQEPPSVAINQIDISTYPRVRAVATVLDGNGVPLTGLTPDQFQLYEGEVPLAISQVQSAEDGTLPLSVVVAVDVSGSMAGDALAEAKLAANAFVRELGPSDQATVIVFNDEVHTVVPFTRDQVDLTNGFSSLQAAGGTALYQAVEASVFAARTEASGRQAVVLLTDGQNETQRSTATMQEALAAAGDAGVPFFTVGFGANPDVAFLESLATGTRGQFMAANAANVGAVYNSIAALLRNQYIVDFTAASAGDGSTGPLKLHLVLGDFEIETNTTYQRGVAATAVPTAAPTPTGTPEGAAASDGGGGGGGAAKTALVVFGIVVGLVAAGGLGFLLISWLGERRVMRRQTAVIAGNPMQAAAQPLPRPVGALYEEPLVLEAGTGRLIERTGEGERVHKLGAGGVVIGSARRVCTIMLPEADDVAPEHARIWLRDGRYLLHHAGGFRRRTLVNGREADWVRLENGDELQLGSHRFTFEDEV